MKPIKLGILGVSQLFITKVIPPLLKSKIVEVYGIASRDEAKAKETAVKYGIPKSYATYEDLLKDPAIEMVYIPLPNHMHSEWIKKCADYKKHVICEKPITLNAKEAVETVEYAKKKGIKLMEAFMYRFHPQWKRALEIVKFGGDIGTIQAIHTFFSYFNNDPNNIRNIKETGGGAILDIGCYAVSSSRFLLQAEPKRVISTIDVDPNFKTDFLANAILDFGSVRTLFTVGTQSFPCQYVEVHGTSGILTVELPFNMYPDTPARVFIKNGHGERCLYLGPDDQYGLEFEAFALAIQNGEEVPTPPADAINNMKVLDAIFKSGETGKWENV